MSERSNRRLRFQIREKPGGAGTRLESHASRGHNFHGGLRNGSPTGGGCVSKLDELLADFDGADPDEALEMLIEFAGRLPRLSAHRSAVAAPAACRVQECQTPVDLWVDTVGGRVF